MFSFINKTHKSNYDTYDRFYVDVVIDYKSLEAIGVKVSCDEMEFIINQYNQPVSVTYNFSGLMNTPNKYLRYPTEQEWRVIMNHIDEINNTLFVAGGNPISLDRSYWVHSSMPFKGKHVYLDTKTREFHICDDDEKKYTRFIIL